MMFYCLSIVYILIDVCSSGHKHGWNYISLHCRDNDNKPVDWWYVYKPPMGAAPRMEFGRNFSYIMPDEAGRWKTSDRNIDANSMLQHTLSPLFRPTYANNLAVIAYSDKTEGTSKSSSAHGLMMADEMGGAWMGHTVPGLIDFTMDRPKFPNTELDKGHLIVCLSLDLPTLKLVASAIKEASPTVVHMKVPHSIRQYLPSWQYFHRPANISSSLPVKTTKFLTTDGSLRATMLVRRPGDKRCLYRTFARATGVILDVYGHDKRMPRVCDKSHGVRIIDSISLKYKDSVYYIDKKRDRANFAVSTAVHWQKKGQGPRQFWTCVSNVESEDSTDKGGLIMCVENYDVWWSFDNMKVKQPNC